MGLFRVSLGSFLGLLGDFKGLTRVFLLRLSRCNRVTKVISAISVILRDRVDLAHRNRPMGLWVLVFLVVRQRLGRELPVALLPHLADHARGALLLEP